MKVLAIGNIYAHGGKAKDQILRYTQFLQSDSSIDSKVYLTKKGKDYDGIDQAVKKFNPDVISILGGDGTVNDVINVEFARQFPLHLIPAGSGNDFSHLMNGHQTETKSFELVRSNKRKEVDTGTCNGQWFLNGVGIGFDGSIARQTVRMKLPFSTTWKYWIAILRNVLFYRSQNITVQWSEQTISSKIFMISVANGTEYGGGFRVSPNSDPCDNQLNLVIVHALHPIKRLFQIPIVEKGRHLSKTFVQHHLIQTVALSCEEIMYAHLDGELMESKHFDIRTTEKIRIVV